MEDHNFDGRSTRRTDREWITGPGDQEHEPPKMVRDWRARKDANGKLTQPIDFDWEKSQAKRILASLMNCTHDWVKNYIKKRRTLDKQDATDSAQAIFAIDRLGLLDDFGKVLRDMRLTTGTAEAMAHANADVSDRQIQKITTWVDSNEPDHSHVNQETRTALTLHCSITAEELAVLSELHRTYDRALCHFMKYVLSPTFARYVNALRLKALASGDKFGWKDHEQAVLEQLIDSTEPNDIMDFHLRVRDERVPCYIWIAERSSERKMLEEDGVKYPELTWISYVIHMLSNEERHILNVPSDSVLITYSLDQLTLAAANSDPKSFKVFKHSMITSSLGKRTLRIHRLLKAEEKGGKANDQNANKNDKNGKTGNGKDNPKEKGEKKSQATNDTKQSKGKKLSAAQIKALELPAALPQKDGKPDKAIYGLLTEGKTRQRVWQRIEDGSCIRCGSPDHKRADCPQSEKNWEKDFNKGTFWEKPSFQQRVQSDGSDLLAVKIPDCHLFSNVAVLAGLDTMSNVNTCLKHLLVELEPVDPLAVSGLGGSIEVTERGYLPVNDLKTGDVIKIPFFAVAESDLPGGYSCILGLPAVRKYAISVDRCLATENPHLYFSGNKDAVLARVAKGAAVAPEISSGDNLDCSKLSLENLLNSPEEKPDITPSFGRSFYLGWNLFQRFLLFLLALFAWTGDLSFAPESALLPGTPGGGLPILQAANVLVDPVNNTTLARVDFHDGHTPMYFPEHFSDPPIQHVQKCSFRSDRALRAIATVVDHAAVERNIEISVDSGSDVNYALRELLVDVHPIQVEPVDGIGGSVLAREEGTLRVVTLSGEEKCIPALVAEEHPSHLPRNCKALIGEAGIEDLNVDTNAQRISQRQPLQCNLSEKRLRTWWDANAGQSIETKPFDIQAVDVNPELPSSVRDRILNVVRKYLSVFEGSKGSLPKPFKTDPIELNFVPGCTPSSVPEPKWSYGFGKVVEQWAVEGIKNGLLEPSQSEWASRPHIVLKPPPGVHANEANIEDCKLRVVGDYRLVNKAIAKLVPNLPTGIDELEKGAGFHFYFEADAHSCYNSFVLKPGRSREALAVWTPIGLVQPCVLPFGQKNSGTEAQGPYRIAMAQLSADSRQHVSNYVDDFMGYANSTDDLCARFEDFLSVCAENHITLNPHKVRVGYSSATFFGFEVDKDGTRLAEKHLDPIKNMVPPSNTSELRSVLGVFQQSRKYIDKYAHIVKPLTRMTGSTVAFQWDEKHQRAYDNIRDRLLNGVHLSAPDYDYPFHLFTGASDDGKGAVLAQFPTLSSQYPYTKEHNAKNMRVISYYSKCWTDAERNRPPYYLEANALLWGMDKARFYALSSRFPLYTYSDHQPLKWMEKSEKGPVSSYMLEHLSDLDTVHQYIKGKANLVADSVSRYPLLGPRRLAPKGLHHSFLTVLDRLPDDLKSAELVQVHAGTFTVDMTRLVQAWRSISKPPIIQKPVKAVDPPARCPHLVIVAPRVDLAPLVLARLLTTSTPFAVLLPIDLVPQSYRPHLLDGISSTLVKEQFESAAKITMLESQMIWVVGNVLQLRGHVETFSGQLRTPAPLVSYSATVDPDVDSDHSAVPSTMEEWANSQQSDPDFAHSLPEQGFLTTHRGSDVQLYVPPDEQPKIIVPDAVREPLVRKIHADMFHLGSAKIYAAMKKSYYWHSMKTDCRKWLQSCPECELQKATRNEAHALFSSRPLTAPRTRWCMDFQGMGKALTGECEVLAFIDSTARFVVVAPMLGRSSEFFVPAFLDHVVFKHGAPDILHSDDAPEFLSEALKILSDSAGITRTTTLGHHAQGNAIMEVWWRYWNRCMRLLPDSHYSQWPRFAHRIAFCYNTAIHSSLGNISPFEVFYGVPAVNPYTTGPPTTDLDGPLPDVNIDDVKSFARAVQRSTAAFASLAKHHDEYVRLTTAERLNEHGNPRDYSVGDSVKIYVPPSHAQMQAHNRPAKHLTAWRGPCRIVEKLSATAYQVQEEVTNRMFQRTLINLRPYRAAEPPAPPPFDPFYDDPLQLNELIAVRDTPDSQFYVARITGLTPDSITVHYFGSRSRNLSQATFRPCFIHAATDTITIAATQPIHQVPYSGTLVISDLDELLVSRKLELLASDRLAVASRHTLHSVRSQLATF